MATLSERIGPLMDGPPPRIPARVEAGMHIANKRLHVWDNHHDGWVDARAVGDPYWYDKPTGLRWHHGDIAPGPTSGQPATLMVAICSEPDWYDARRAGTQPKWMEWPAFQVWIESAD